MIFVRFCVAAILLLMFQACLAAQSARSLVEVLRAISEKQLSAWQRHDLAAYLAVREAGFMYVGPLEIIEPGHPVDNIMRCEVVSFSLTKAQAISVDSNTAILIAQQHQDATCFGMKQPTLVNITETYVRRGVEWKLLLHTEAPAISLPKSTPG